MLFLANYVYQKREKTRRYLLNGHRIFQMERADNRIFNLRVIGSASMRLALLIFIWILGYSSEQQIGFLFLHLLKSPACISDNTAGN